MSIEWSEDGIKVTYCNTETGHCLKLSWQKMAELASAAEPFVGGSHSYTRRFAQGDWSPETILNAFRDLEQDLKQFQKRFVYVDEPEDDDLDLADELQAALGNFEPSFDRLVEWLDKEDQL